MTIQNNKIKKYLKFIVLMLLVLVSLEFIERTPWKEVNDNGDNRALVSAWQKQQSKVWMTVKGEVNRILWDDNEGSRHQRFLLTVNNQISVLVAHNIDIAPRVPLKEGDELELRGRYEWNEKGGVLHWTHIDPGGYKDGGWIRLGDKVYK